MKNQHEALAALNYLPATPQSYLPPIGLIGCGGITEYHLLAYKNAGFNVVALCDIDLDKAKQRAAEYFPDATCCSDYRELLCNDSIEVVDITTHPPQRPPIIEAALSAKKHVLSQKPFVLDLDVGERLIDVASKNDCYLVVNQNGRWAPHFSYARAAAQSGLLGDCFAAHMGCHWDHTWVAGTEFENVKHLVLYDYAIHWFDMIRCLLPGKEAKRVYASTARVVSQKLKPDLLGQTLIEFDGAQSTMSFDAALPHGPLEETFVGGTDGTVHSTGTGNQQQLLTVTTSAGKWTPSLQGKWFPDGFHGTMGELLCAIEENRECVLDARDNLKSLALCFAAIASAESGEPVTPGSVRSMPT